MCESRITRKEKGVVVHHLCHKPSIFWVQLALAPGHHLHKDQLITPSNLGVCAGHLGKTVKQLHGMRADNEIVTVKMRVPIPGQYPHYVWK